METFVIRIARGTEKEEAGSDRELRGTVERVGSGRRESFRDTRELLAFLQSEHQQNPEEVEQ
jgi:hypothetical protein